MDAFTEKLLARTQARKAALSNKREEVARRSPAVNSPRRPLVETNSTPTTTKQNTKGSSVVVTSAPFAGGTPKSVFYEKYSKQASLRQKECFIELGETKEALKKNTIKKDGGGCIESRISKSSNKVPATVEPIEDIQKSSLASNTDSPSVKDRKAQYMKQVQVVSITAKSIPSTKEDREADNTVDKANTEKVYPNVKEPRASLAGGRFFNDPRNVVSEPQTTSEKIDSPVPEKPARVTVPKSKPDEKCEPVIPVKPSRSAAGQAPPSKPPRVQLTKVSSVDIKLSTTEQSSSNNVKRIAPAPPPEDASPKKMITEDTATVQKATKRCEEEIKSDIPNKKTAIEGSNGVCEKRVESVKTANILSPNKDYLSVGVTSPIVKESTPTQDGQKDNIKRTLKSQKISAISLGDMHEESNAHEITFNIDMTEFDQVLEDEKESMFQMTYDERVVKAAGQKNICDDYEMSVPVQALHKGVHKSGYHSVYSDQYAAVVTPKKVKSAPTRSYTIHERIQMLLEDAAYQQNIVLQASQAVNTCFALHDGASTGSSEEVEAERLLKFATERRTACLNEVQKLKNGEDDVEINEQHGEKLPCKATLTVSEIRVPIDQKLIQNKNPLEPCIYSFICMVKHNPKQMYCTKAVTSEEIKNGCIIFDDTFQIKNVKPSFLLDISLFVLKTQLPSVTPTNKHKRKTMMAKKKSCDGASQANTPGVTNGPVFRTSDFNLVSTTVINLENVHHGRYKTTQVGEKSYLNGDLKISVSCNPEYFNEAKGFLTVFEDVGGLGDWLRYWCILDGNVLRYWKYPDEELLKSPLGSINLAFCVSDSVTVVPRDICARPHTMQLVIEKHVTATDRETLIAVNAGGKMVIKYMLSADTKADKMTWLNTLNDSLKDWRAWHCNLMTKKAKKRAETDIIML